MHWRRGQIPLKFLRTPPKSLNEGCDFPPLIRYAYRTSRHTVFLFLHLFLQCFADRGEQPFGFEGFDDKILDSCVDRIDDQVLLPDG